MLSCVFEVFSAFRTFSNKVVQTWFVWHETWHRTLFHICYCFKIFRIKKKIVICLKLRAKLHFWRLFSVFAISRIKWFKLGLFDTKHGTQHYLAYVFLLKWLATKNINIYLKLCAKLRFWGFFSIFCTFSKKVVQTWFVWHETRHTNYLVYFFVLKWLELISIVICLKLRAKFLF